MVSGCVKTDRGSVNRSVNRGQSSNLDTTVACILTRRSDQGGTRLHKAKTFQIIADPSISAASTSLRQKNTVVPASSTIMGCQDLLTDPYCPSKQFGFARRRRSHYPLCHESDFVLPPLKLKPD